MQSVPDVSAIGNGLGMGPVNALPVTSNNFKAVNKLISDGNVPLNSLFVR